jgi:predicted Zn finger-like uncharacterized protein
MIITCKNCNTSFNLNDELVKDTGSKVKCSKCNYIFQVFPLHIQREPETQQSDLFREPQEKIDTKPFLPYDRQQVEVNKFHHKPDANKDLDLSEIEKILQEEDGKTFDGDTLESDEHQKDYDDFEFAELDDLFDKDDDLAENLSEIDTDLKDSDLDFDFEKKGTPALFDSEEVEEAEDIDLSELDDLFGEDENRSSITSSSFQDLDAMPQDDDGILSTDKFLDDEEEIPLNDGLDKKAKEINLSEIDEFFPNETDDEIDFDFDLDLEMEKDLADDLKNVKSPEDLELDFDFKDHEKKDDLTEFDEEFDLSDLEEIIDLEEESEADTKSLKSKNEEEELEFDLALEPDLDEGTSLTLFLEGDESDLESSEKAVETKSDYSEKSQVPESDMDENREVSEDTEFVMDENREEAFLTEKDDYNLEETEGKIHKVFNTVTLSDTSHSDETDDNLCMEDEQIKPKSGFGKMVIAAVILLLLAAAGYGVFTGFNMSVSQIPIIGSFMKTETPDPGNLKLIAVDLNSKFGENRHAGKIFIITGTIKNEYPEPRSFIKITGKLYGPSKNLSHTEQVYAGNMFSELELRSLDMEAIKNRLNNRLGQNRSNENIEPGQTIPFMIIFSKLPQQLEEFEVLIESSSPA